MADPFAILANSRLDVPSLLNVYQAGKQGRMQDMLFQRQIAAEDRKADAETKRMGVMSRLFQPQNQQPKGGDPTPAAPVNPAEVGAGMGQAMVQPPQQLVDPSQLPPRSDGVRLNPQALQELYQIDPKGAMDIQTMFFNADKAGFERAQQNGETMYKAATLLLDTPPEQRPAVFQSMLPQLRSLGVDDQQLQGIDLSDRGLQNYATLGNTLANVSDARKPKVFSPGDEEQDINGNVLRRSNQPRIVMGPDGVPYEVGVRGGPQTGPANTAAPMPIRNAADYDALPPGATYVDPNGIERVKGGASPQGSRTFP